MEKILEAKRHCPQCYQTRLKAVEDAQELYGKVTRQEYDEAVRNAIDARDNMPETLNEVYYIFNEPGDFLMSVDWSVNCGECGFGYRLNVTRDLQEIMRLGNFTDMVKA